MSIKAWSTDWPDGPQPEGCDLCGSLVSAQDLVLSEAEGLEGLRICADNEFCASARFGPPADIRQPTVEPTIGQGRIFMPGGPLPWEGAS